jgi:hypothetical protein
MELPRCFTWWDWSRSYLLPDDVATNIARRGAVGQYGSWNAARGLLVEICRCTGAVPSRLHYAEIADPAATDPFGVVVAVTAVAELPDGRPLTVTTCTAPHRSPTRPGWWITVVDEVLVDEHRRYPPSLPMQAAIVARRLTDRDPG